MKSVSMEHANIIHDLCNHFISPDGNPNPIHPRKQLSHFQEQKLKEAIREFLIAFGKFTTWQDVELFVHDTQYMSVFDTVNHCDKVFEVSRAADEWKEDFKHIVESAHKISEVPPPRIVCAESLLAVEIKQELEHMIDMASWAIEHIRRYEQGKKS